MIRGKNKKKEKFVRYADVEHLLQRYERELPGPGEYLYDYKLEALESNRQNSEEQTKEQENVKKVFIDFNDLPISNSTKLGLASRNFKKMTEVQRCSIPQALQGRDVLCASKTGSGKTLSYLVPVVERLYTLKYSGLDGPGCIIVVPTRELAIQVFEVLQSISDKHELSQGLLIGGKNIKTEQQVVHTMNILITTPGRLLQHIDESPLLSLHNVITLVLDEADIMLEMGFVNSINAIRQALPSKIQVLMYSATLATNVHQLSKVTLNNPEYILLHNKESVKNNEKKGKLENMYEMPSQLMQYYMLVEAKDKIDTVFSFLKSHQKNKVMVFLNSCKQVRFMFEACKKMRLGMPMFELQGRQKQSKRMAIFFTFAEKKSAVLFTTNIASRGLDFPLVNWILQADCPETLEEYVHRVGRTARLHKTGKALLLLTSQEEPMAEQIKDKHINLHRIAANPNKQLSISKSLNSYVAEDQHFKYLAQRAFVSYVRSLHFANNPLLFNIAKLDVQGLALSMGLSHPPTIKLKQQQQQQQQQQPQNNNNKSSLNKLKQKIKDKKQAKHQALQQQQDQKAEESEEEFFTKKKEQTVFEELQDQAVAPIISKNQMKKIKMDGHFQGRNKIYFDRDGKAYTQEQKNQRQLIENEKLKDVDLANQYGIKVAINQELDTQVNKQKIKEKKLKKKLKLKQQQQEKSFDEEPEVVLGGESEEEYSD